MVEFEEQSQGSSEEFKTPDGGSLSSSFGEQGSQSPTDSPKATRVERVKKLQHQLLLDGMTVKFKDFDVLDLIGEGSFGRVFKVKKRDNG